MQLQASWIWKKQREPNPYNQTVIARRTVRLGRPLSALMAITADSGYRLYINGRWVNDGPARAYPEHYLYDELDVTSYLAAGANEILIVARYLGVGSPHQIPRQAGLLAQLEVTEVGGKKTTIMTDDAWQVAEAHAWRPNTFRRWLPGEIFDARLVPRHRFTKAAVLYPAHGGPWQDLQPRDVALMTREPVPFRAFMGASLVRKDWLAFHFPVARLIYPGLIEYNTQTSVACAVATIIQSPKPRSLRIQTADFKITVNGEPGKDGVYQLRRGRNLLLALATPYLGYHVKEKSIRFIDTGGFTLKNPIDPEHENPWCFVALEECRFTRDDMVFFWSPLAEREALIKSTDALYAQIEREVVDLKSFNSHLGRRAKLLSAEAMLSEDPTRQFYCREVLADALSLVANPAALIHDTPEWTTVLPSPKGDVELAYDLGEQVCGYYDFELMGEEGLIIDLSAIEYILPDGRLQHTCHVSPDVPMPNGMRYVCKEGLNRFTSLVRRSGRYLYLTLRGQTRPARIRRMHVVQSTHPPVEIGGFSSSDPLLDKFWEISARTVKLCMEDTLVDCPLYEQTFWVGDARNEALYALTAFGTTDIVRRGLLLAGQSLERYPMIGCQLPSCWDVILPAWSFMWGLAVWDYYFYTGDLAFLKATWPDVLKNLRGAAEYLDGQGLFSAPFWNMFDWADQDIMHKTVLHNSLFMVGALDAAIKTAAVLKEKAALPWLKSLRRALARALNRLWDEAKGSYPDAVHDNGQISQTLSQHTSFLAILYNVVGAKNLPQAHRNIIDPPDGMVRVGSPFAMQYLYETYEKLGLNDEILDSIYRNFTPMLEAGATTVWESFPSGNLSLGGYPTRSHAHAWSASPVYFLNRLILGIRQDSPGGARFTISPWVSSLNWARGASASAQGPVKVEWKKENELLRIAAHAPQGVRLRFVSNPSLAGLEVIFNGKKIK